MDRAQRIDEKNGVLGTAYYQSQFGQDIYVHLKDLIWLFQNILWIMYFGPNISQILKTTFKNTGY